MAEGKGKRIGMYVGIGCLALTSVCCIGMALAVYVPKSAHDSAAKDHAELFLGHVQRREWAAAYAASQYMGSSTYNSAEQHQACLAATVLGDMTAFSCDDVDSELWAGLDSDGADVTCTVTSAAHGQAEITVHVNSPADMPYLGFIWFSPGTYMGEAWRGDSCASFSGREFYREPPDGRVRP